MKFYYILFFLIFNFSIIQGKHNLAFLMIDDQNMLIPPYFSSFKFDNSIFQKMTQNSHIFHRGVASTPICLPSRSAILFGHESYKSGIFSNRQSYINKFPKHQSLPEILKEEGYQVGIFGKIFHGSEQKLFIKQQNLEYSIKFNGITDNLTIVNNINNKDLPVGKFRNDFKINKRLHYREIVKGFSTDNYSSRQARKFLNERNENQPFALFYGSYRPHMPFFYKNTNKLRNKFFKKFLRKIYLYLEDQYPSYPFSKFFNKFFRAIQSSGRLKQFIKAYLKSSYTGFHAIEKVYRKLQNNLNNTMIVLVSDHGFHLGDLKMWAKGDINMFSSRKPLWIKLPYQEEQVNCHEWVSSSSLFHTILTHLNISRKPKQEIDSRDLINCKRNPVMSINNMNTQYALFWKN